MGGYEEPGERSRLTGHAARLLATGIVILEFGTAVTTFVAATLLPVIVRDLEAGSQISVLVSGGTVGLFLAMPVAGYIVTSLGTRVTLAAGLILTVVGGVVSATATTAWIFGAGRLTSGLAGGVLAIFGLSAAVRYLHDSLRKRVIAISASMWILPGLIGPALTAGLEHLTGWRVTMLVPVVLVVLARILILRAVPGNVSDRSERPLLATFFVPIGIVGFIAFDDRHWLAWSSLVAACVGFLALMPKGFSAFRPGAPAGLAGLTLFSFGFFGATTLVTLLFTSVYGVSLAFAGVALGVAPVAWALASLTQDRLEARGIAPNPTPAVVVCALCVAAIGPFGAVGLPFLLGGCLWAVAGASVGIFYPTLYLRATTPSDVLNETQVATAAVSAEAYGSLLGGALGGTLISWNSGQLLVNAYSMTYILFGTTLGLAAIAVHRSRHRG